MSVNSGTWGTAGLSNFVPTSHAEIYDAIKPSKVTLPKPCVICVVGGSRGIGSCIAYAYTKAGATGLVLAARRVSGLESTAADCKSLNPNIDIEVVPCDITSAESVSTLAERVNQRFGRLDIVAINSGYSGPVELKMTDTDPKTFQQAIDVNYVGTFLCAKYLIPILLDSPNGLKNFIAVSSMASMIIRGPVANAQYCVSKLAQLKLMENVHEQYYDAGVLSFSVHPGAVDSEMARETAPEAFMMYLTDSPKLCGAFCLWLTNGGEKRDWLCGRLLSAKYDVGELESRKDEVVKGDLLKVRMSL